MVNAKFGCYRELFPLVSSVVLFPYERHQEDANTWLPEKKFSKEKEKFQRLHLEYEEHVARSSNKGLNTREKPSQRGFFSSSSSSCSMKTPKATQEQEKQEDIYCGFKPGFLKG